MDYVYGWTNTGACIFAVENFRQRTGPFDRGKTHHVLYPSWDVSKLVNWARIKGAVWMTGRTVLCIVEDQESQNRYGVHQAVWNLPEAYDAADAKRWGENQISQYKAPVKSAKISGVRLEYLTRTGPSTSDICLLTGWRKSEGWMGMSDTYPIKKIKYTSPG